MTTTNTIADRVRETTATQGTGTVNLAGAVIGFQSFASAFTTGTTVYYCITDGTNWEVGSGVFTSGSPSTLSRVAVIASSNSNALVNFTASSMDVFNCIPANQIVGITNTQILTNKSITARSNSISGTLTPTPVADTTDICNISLDQAGSSTIQIPSYNIAPTHGQCLLLKLKDNGTSRTYTLVGTAGGYRLVGTALQSATVVNKITYIACVYNSADSYWDVVGIVNQA